jgi:hypothetical protein
MSDSLKAINNPAFPLPVPVEEGLPVEWSQADIAYLATLPPEQFQQHVLKMLQWYVDEDDVNLGQPGNDYWEAGYYMAKAVLAASKLKTSNKVNALLAGASLKTPT